MYSGFELLFGLVLELAFKCVYAVTVIQRAPALQPARGKPQAESHIV